MYLFLCHMVLLCIPRNRLELQRSYLPVFFLKRRKAQTATEAVEQDSNDEDMSFCSRKCVEMQIEVRNLRRKVLVEAYKMTAPARQWAMIVEDAPQGFLAAVVSLTNGFRLFTVAVSIFVPSLRIAFSRLLHDRIAWAVQGWMLQEALDALDHDRFEVCDEFLASIFRLRWVFPERDLGVSLCESSRSTIEEVVRKFLEVRPFRRRHEELDGPEAFVRLMCLELLGREEPGPSSWGEEFIEILKQMRSHELTNVAETIAMASRRIRFRDWREETLALLRPSPRLISKLTQITSLSLNDSRSLEGLDQLKNLTSLQLELQRKAIGSEGCGPLGEGLAQLKNLTSVQLQLQGSGIRSEDCRPLGEGLAQLKNLTSVQLQLQENKIGQEGCKLLGEGLAQLKSLTSLQLQLQKNEIGSEGCRCLGEGLAQLKNLTTFQLQLQENEIGSEGCRPLGEGLAQLKNLTSVQLQLQENRIGSEGCRALGRGMAQLINLTSAQLELQKNLIFSEGCRALGQSLTPLINLTSVKIDLQDNEIGFEGRAEIRQSLAQLKNLTSVELRLLGTDIPIDPKSEWGRSMHQSLTPLMSMFPVSPVSAAARAGRHLAFGLAS